MIGVRSIRILNIRKLSKLKISTALSGFGKKSNEKLQYGFYSFDQEISSAANFGEDAYFLHKTDEQFDIFGIADGVGGWARQGIDPRWKQII